MSSHLCFQRPRSAHEPDNVYVSLTGSSSRHNTGGECLKSRGHHHSVICDQCVLHANCDTRLTFATHAAVITYDTCCTPVHNQCRISPGYRHRLVILLAIEAATSLFMACCQMQSRWEGCRLPVWLATDKLLAALHRHLSCMSNLLIISNVITMRTQLRLLCLPATTIYMSLVNDWTKISETLVFQK